jgi:hypothetical protein
MVVDFLRICASVTFYCISVSFDINSLDSILLLLSIVRVFTGLRQFVFF